MFSIDTSEELPTFSVPSMVSNTVCALVFHEVDYKTIVTKHPINDGVMGKGIAINQQHVFELCQHNSMEDENEKSELLPNNLLLRSGTDMMWYTKSQQRLMWFRINQSVSFKVWWPALLWYVKGKHLYVFALGSNQRPNKSTKLYRAPLMNIDANGLLCQGSATLPEICTPHNLSKIEACVFDSNFTHLNQANSEQGELYSDSKNHLKFWRKRNNKATKIKVADMAYYCRLAEIMT